MEKETKPSYMNIVFWVSSVVILMLVIWGGVSPGSLADTANAVFGFTTKAFGWFYLITVVFFVLFCIVLAFSKYGKIKLGNADDDPDYPFFTWIGMLFSCGFGVGLVFYGVAEPLTHFGTPPLNVESQSTEAARLAMRYSFFNWGVHQWSVFTIVGLSIAYFQFRRKEKGLISTTLNPLIGTDGKGALRKTIEILAVIATVMGVATSLGLGILQINGGLNYVFSIPQNTTVLLIITAVMLVLYLASATTGLDKGIKYLSNLNLSLALLLMLVVLFLGPTIFILQSFTLAIGDYIQNFFRMSFHLTPYEGGTWAREWTIFYWAWVIAWSPFVGSFIARISRGRSIREFIFGVLIVPPFIACVWIGVFGGAALHMDLFQGTMIAEAVNNDVTSALFVTLEHFPLGLILSILSIMLIFTFLITSADSATFVLGMMTTGGHLNPSTTIKVIWGILIAAISAVLIISSGLTGLQTASLTSAVPFTFVLLAMCFSLYKALRKDYRELKMKEQQKLFEKFKRTKQ